MIRLPKKVIINNIPFKVIRDNKYAGGSFSYSDATITVGTKRLSDREILENFIHEVAEISTVERGMRGSKCKPLNGSEDYIFAGSHAQFGDVISDVSWVIADLMKLE
jgi:hypothetical protein